MLSYPKCKKTVYNYPEVLCFRLTASKEKPRREDTQLLVVQDSFSPLKRNYKPSQILGSLLLYWCDKAPKFSTEISNMQWKTQWHFSGVLGFDGPGGLAQNEFCLGISTHHTLPKIHTHNSIKKLVGDAISPSIQKTLCSSKRVWIFSKSKILEVSPGYFRHFFENCRVATTATSASFSAAAVAAGSVLAWWTQRRGQ